MARRLTALAWAACCAGVAAGCASHKEPDENLVPVALPLPSPVEWRQPLPMAVSSFLPYTPRRFIEPARGPPFA